MDELLKKYANIKGAIKEFEDQAEVISKQIVEAMEKEKLDKLEKPFGNFTLVAKKSYTYTDNVKNLMDKVKLAKHKEEEQGKAKFTVSNYLLFKQPK